MIPVDRTIKTESRLVLKKMIFVWKWSLHTRAEYWWTLHTNCVIKLMDRLNFELCWCVVDTAFKYCFFKTCKLSSVSISKITWLWTERCILGHPDFQLFFLFFNFFFKFFFFYFFQIFFQKFSKIFSKNFSFNVFRDLFYAVSCADSENVLKNVIRSTFGKLWGGFDSPLFQNLVNILDSVFSVKVMILRVILFERALNSVRFLKKFIWIYPINWEIWSVLWIIFCYAWVIFDAKLLFTALKALPLA